MGASFWNGGALVSTETVELVHYVCSGYAAMSAVSSELAVTAMVAVVTGWLEPVD